MNCILPDFEDSEDNFRYERFLYSTGNLCVAGCDEAGRGPLAGPVVAACVVLPRECDHCCLVDSKILTHNQRLNLSDYLRDIGAAFGIGIVSEQKIDEINILQASLLAMKKAVKNLKGPVPDYILIDGKFTLPLRTSQTSLIKGESKSSSIAAASILAKVERDRIMVLYHQQFPAYNFQNNKGYPTLEHRKAIQANGICLVHRKTFKGVREYVEQSATSWEER